MANIQRVINWVLNNSSQLKLEVTKVTWIEEWIPGYYDYQASITVKGNKYIGRGTDKEEPIAFVKAVAESFDRAVVSDLDVPWACAAHTNIKSASKNSYYELLSIDREICHHYCKKKIYPINEEILKSYLPLRTLQKMLDKHKLELRIYELKPTKDANIVEAIVWSRDPNCEILGFVNGFGADLSKEEASKHAVLECLRTAIGVFVGGFNLKDSFKSLTSQESPRWHFWQALKKESREYLEKYLIPKPGEEINLEVENISINDVNFTQINTLNSIFPDIPLVFVQASSNKLIKPQFGKFSPDTYTMNRLKVFNGGPVEIDTNIPPHFYG